ncbi:MAG: hypothetical protein IJN63_10875 [Clostridia bacterium]|nr:hypothetical protein [Clostridia bacterium]
MKKRVSIKNIIIGTILGMIAFYHLFIISGAFALLYEDPLEPVIKYGEFPITVIYELNGEIKERKDVIVCEYAGIENWGTGGKHRKWTSEYISGNDYLFLLMGEEDGVKFTLSVEMPNWLASYYMDDLDPMYREERERELKRINQKLLLTQFVDGGWVQRTLAGDEVYEKYKLRVLEVRHSLPINNSYYVAD